MELDEARLNVIYNEAERQRYIEAHVQRRAHYDKEFNKTLNKVLKVHGPYTAGFHRKELDKLKEKLGSHGTRVHSSS